MINSRLRPDDLALQRASHGSLIAPPYSGMTGRGNGDFGPGGGPRSLGLDVLMQDTQGLGARAQDRLALQPGLGPGEATARVGAMKSPAASLDVAAVGGGLELVRDRAPLSPATGAGFTLVPKQSLEFDRAVVGPEAGSRGPATVSSPQIREAQGRAFGGGGGGGDGSLNAGAIAGMGILERAGSRSAAGAVSRLSELAEYVQGLLGESGAGSPLRSKTSSLAQLAAISADLLDKTKDIDPSLAQAMARLTLLAQQAYELKQRRSNVGLSFEEALQRAVERMEREAKMQQHAQSLVERAQERRSEARVRRYMGLSSDDLYGITRATDFETGQAGVAEARGEFRNMIREVHNRILDLKKKENFQATRERMAGAVSAAEQAVRDAKAALVAAQTDLENASFEDRTAHKDDVNAKRRKLKEAEDALKTTKDFVSSGGADFRNLVKAAEAAVRKAESARSAFEKASDKLKDLAQRGASEADRLATGVALERAREDLKQAIRDMLAKLKELEKATQPPPAKDDDKGSGDEEPREARGAILPPWACMTASDGDPALPAACGEDWCGACDDDEDCIECHWEHVLPPPMAGGVAGSGMSLYAGTPSLPESAMSGGLAQIDAQPSENIYALEGKGVRTPPDGPAGGIGSQSPAVAPQASPSGPIPYYASPNRSPSAGDVGAAPQAISPEGSPPTAGVWGLPFFPSLSTAQAVVATAWPPGEFAWDPVGTQRARPPSGPISPDVWEALNTLEFKDDRPLPPGIADRPVWGIPVRDFLALSDERKRQIAELALLGLIGADVPPVAPKEPLAGKPLVPGQEYPRFFLAGDPDSPHPESNFIQVDSPQRESDQDDQFLKAVEEWGRALAEIGKLPFRPPAALVEAIFEGPKAGAQKLVPGEPLVRPEAPPGTVLGALERTVDPAAELAGFGGVLSKTAKLVARQVRRLLAGGKVRKGSPVAEGEKPPRAPGDDVDSKAPEGTRLQRAGSAEPTARERALGTDPKKGYNPLEKDGALRLEERIGSEVTRDPSGAGDFVDRGGNVYDLIGPVPPKFFSLSEFISQINDHLLKSVRYVVVDMTGLGQAEMCQIRCFINGLSPDAKARLIVLGE